MLRLDHVVRPVRDAAASLAFYRDVLGLPLVAAHTGDDWGGFAWLMMIFGLGDARELVLVELRGAPAPGFAGLPDDARHYALAVETGAELAAWRARLAAAGVASWNEDHGDQQSVYFADPDGVILEITTPPSSPGRAADPRALRTVEAWVAGAAA